MNNSSDNRHLKPLFISLAICLPGCLLLFYFMHSPESDWWLPRLLFMGIVIFAVIDFVLLNYLDSYREKVNQITLIILSASIFFTFLFFISKVSQSIYPDMGFEYLLPGVIALLGFSLFGIFKERQIFLKLYLGANSLALALLWGLGASNAIYLP